MRQWYETSYVQIMACRLISANPLSETMLIYYQLDPWNKLQWNSNENSNLFIQENAFGNVVCEMASVLCWPHMLRLLSNGTVSHNWGHYHGILLCSKVIVFHFKIRHPQMQSLDDLLWLDLKVRHQDHTPIDGSQGDMPYWISASCMFYIWITWILFNPDLIMINKSAYTLIHLDL